MLADEAEKSAPSDSAIENQEGGKDEGTLKHRRLYPIVRRKAHGFLKFIFSHRMIPLLKGTFTVTHTSGLVPLD